MALALALPPLHIFPAILALGILPGLLAEAPRWRIALLRLWLFNLGYFLAGLYWVGIAFFADAERFGALALPGVAGLAAILALIGALPLSLAWIYFRARPVRLCLALAVLWVVADQLRGAWGVQFPWNPPAIVWALSPAMMQSIAWIGVPGLSLVTVLAGTSIGSALLQGRWRAALPMTGALALLLAAGAWRLDRQALDPAPGITLRIIQASIAQHHKWDPEKVHMWFRKHLELTARPGRFDVLVWPESSVPYRLERDEGARAMIAEVMGTARVALVGSDHVDLATDPPTVHNSVYAIGAEGRLLDRFDKVDLVPFGEFLPFRPVLGLLGLDALAIGAVDFSSGPGRRSMNLGDVPPASPLICYEAVFPGDATDATGTARWLLNITNDAWFGVSSGPYQHLAMARMRAVEAGLPLVRAANTGISVVTDAYGRVLHRLDLMQPGVIDAELPPALAVPPPVSRWPWLVWLLPGIAAIGAGAGARRAPRSGNS